MFLFLLYHPIILSEIEILVFIVISGSSFAGIRKNGLSFDSWEGIIERMSEQQEKISGGMFRAAGVVRSVSVYLPATVVYRGLSFVRGLVLAWLLARETGQYGLLTIGLQAMNILAPLASLGLCEAVTRYVPAYLAKKTLRSFLGYACGLTIGVTILANILLLIFSRPVGQAIFAGKEIDLAAVMPLARVTFAGIGALIVFFLVVGILKGLRMFPALAYMELVHGVFYFLITILAVVFLGPKAVNVMWMYIIALLVPAVIWGVRLRRRLPKDKTTEEPPALGMLTRQLMGYGFWAAVAGISWQGWQTYSLWHLTKFDSGLNSDIFAASRLLGQLVLIIGAALAAVVTTSVCMEWEKGRRESANFQFDLYAKGVLMGLLVSTVVLIGLRGVLAFIFPAKFMAVKEILPATFLFYQFLTVLTFLAIRFILIEKMHLMLWAWLAGLGANIGLGFWWIRPEGALAGAANAAAWSCVPAILIMLGFIRLRKQPVSMGMILIIAASVVLVLPVWAAGLVVLGLLVWSVMGNQVFDDRQRAMIFERVLLWRMK
jgi:O-antigen/teichoic acid export membrane protein